MYVKVAYSRMDDYIVTWHSLCWHYSTMLGVLNLYFFRSFVTV